MIRSRCDAPTFKVDYSASVLQEPSGTLDDYYVIDYLEYSAAYADVAAYDWPGADLTIEDDSVLPTPSDFFGGEPWGLEQSYTSPAYAASG